MRYMSSPYWAMILSISDSSNRRTSGFVISRALPLLMGVPSRQRSHWGFSFLSVLLLPADSISTHSPNFMPSFFALAATGSRPLGSQEPAVQSPVLFHHSFGSF